MGVVLGVLVLVFAGLVVFTGIAQRWSVQQSSGGGASESQTAPGAAPMSSDLVTVRRELAGLASVVVSPAARVVAPRPVAAAKARALRARLITWRDGFELTAHQVRVLDNAIAYAGALGRWLKTPQDAVRHAAAGKAWRAWRAADPGMRRI
jgi:hypothetical protein